MSGVNGVSVARPSSSGQSDGTPGASSSGDAPDLNDAAANALLAFHALLLRRRDTATTDHEERIAEWEESRDREIENEKQAIQRAVDADRDRGGFLSDVGSALKHAVGDVATLHFSDAIDDVNRDCVQDPQFWKDMESGAGAIGRWAALAGSALLVASSMGAATPALILACSALALNGASVAEADFHAFEKLGMTPETASWVGVACSVGGSLALAGASAAAAGNDAMARAARASDALNMTGVAGSAVVRGGAGIGVAKFREDAADAETDAKAAQLSRARIQRHIERALDELKDTYASVAKQLDAIHQSARESAHARA